MSARALFLALVLIPPWAFAQRPVINPGGAVNAAGLLPVNQTWSALAPGSIASLFGQNLASRTASAPGFPLPTTLAGTSVTANGTKVPLFYVSPHQINFQVPSNVPWDYYDYTQVLIIVTTAAGSSDPLTANIASSNAMIFTQDGGGCGHPGAILNVSPDGKLSLNAPKNSVAPGEFIEIYGTGIGQVYNSPPDGSPALSNPLSAGIVGGAGATFDPESTNASVDSEFGGRAPGLVGVDQVNVMVPAGVREGCAVPVFIGPAPATISIHTGGGQCVDPPIQSAGSLLLMRSVVLNDSTVPEADTLSGSFAASPAKQLPPPPPPPGLIFANFVTNVSPPPNCAIPGYSTPDAGVLTINGPGLSAKIPPTTSNGATSYTGALAKGSVQEGSYQISAPGGNGIGKFQLALEVGPGITITSQFPPKFVLSFTGEPLVVNWTGGVAGEFVTVTVLTHYTLLDRVSFSQTVPATAGSASFPASPGLSGDEIDVQVGPDPTQPQTFTAPGLTLGGRISWAVQYRFIGLALAGN